MRAILALILCTASAFGDGAENLVANPGFERLVEDVPFGWQAYVGPQEQDGGGGGAVAAVDYRAHTGEACVRLHTPVPYARDPANNWSQNILKDLADEKVIVSAMVRTENATDATLWLQCWRKKPWGVLHVARSDEETPLHGTNDWTPVRMEVEVPKGTDFVTLRCVLKGVGTAWFDDVSLARAEKVSETPVPKPVAPPTETTPEVVPVTEKEDAPAPVETPTEEADEPDMRDAAATTAAELERLQDELRQLHDLNTHLEDALDGASEDNDLLLQDMLMLQESLDEMEDRQRALLRPFIGEGQFAPPLVPKGADWRKLL